MKVWLIHHYAVPPSDPPPIKESSFKVRTAIEIGLKNIGGIYGEEELYAGANHIQTARG